MSKFKSLEALEQEVSSHVVRSAETYASLRAVRELCLSQLRSHEQAVEQLKVILEKANCKMVEYEDGPVWLNGRPL